MNFKELLLQAKEGKEPAAVALLEMYKPLLVKNAIVNSRFDEDLYQELCIILLKCIAQFRM
ncbi:helix-turn-helix domain-containing protein [Enterocloster clostridioformis]|uniref:Helix-turn-helix domain n=1 Tax=Enterocloster clostridioformis TaxID=1531 RepID=A0A2X2W8Z8_9FIRM|nr:helix-turn-helix domain-containing protein [Enterocloster clostridioformis]MCA5577281.1 helix-turn-helix domain-containing protein [Enterocloster clostridioformis]SQB10149.1 Helix-turn-helix domain [Enterocloster clostridioformis]